MSPELVFWPALAIKMAVAALFVSVATIIAERRGAVAGALVAALPVSAGPAYVFLALDHDAAFISASAVVPRGMHRHRRVDANRVTTEQSSNTLASLRGTTPGQEQGGMHDAPTA